MNQTPPRSLHHKHYQCLPANFDLGRPQMQTIGKHTLNRTSTNSVLYWRGRQVSIGDRRIVTYGTSLPRKATLPQFEMVYVYPVGNHQLKYRDKIGKISPVWKIRPWCMVIVSITPELNFWETVKGKSESDPQKGSGAVSRTVLQCTINTYHPETTTLI